MKRERFFRQVVAGTICCSLLLPRWAHCQTAQQAFVDVALGKGGTLQGQLVDTAGQPVSGAEVQVGTSTDSEQTTWTDQEGTFVLHGMRGGLCHVTVAGKQGIVVRAWAEGTAPPAAQPAVLMVEGDTTVRGVCQLLTNPWLLGGIIAAAVVLPLTLDDDESS